MPEGTKSMTLLPLHPILSHSPASYMPQRGKVGPNIRDGAILRARREELNLSQVALALIYGSSQTYISSVERGWEGIQSASLDWIKRYATALNWSAEELMDAVGIEHAKARGGTPVFSTGRQHIDYPVRISSASVEVLVNTTGSAEGAPDIVNVVVNAPASTGDLRGLRMGHMYLNSVPSGMIALYDPAQIEPPIGALVALEIGGEHHVAYALADGYVETDRPISPTLPVRFRPDAILGVVVQRVDDQPPRRLN